MRIALVAPAPDPPILGGAENLHAGLVDFLSNETGHSAELIRIPVRETSLADLVAGYEAFARLDVSSYDAVISTKYPAWMVSHPNHTVYMLHRCRGFYDWYPEAELGGCEYRGGVEAIDNLLRFMQRRAEERDALPEFFARFEELKRNDAAKSEIARHPGPLGRSIVHFLDGVGLSRRYIRRYAAIADTVRRRRDYFPAGARVAVLHPPTSKTGFHSASDDYFFTVSRFYPSKRIEMLIDAFRLTDIPVPFRIAGTGDEEAKLRAHAGDDPRIQFLGYLEDAQVVELYAHALAIPFAPADEDFGYIALEAMLAGKPVVTTSDSGGPLELVRDGETGIVAEPGAESLARAFRRVYEDRDWARSLGARGRERARSIGWHHVVPRLLADVPSKRAPVPRGAVRAKVTVLNSYSVHPPNHGGRYRMHWIYRTLARHVDVELVTLGLRSEGGARIWADEGFCEIRVPRSAAHEKADLAAQAECGVPVYDITALEHIHLTPEYLDALRASLAGSSLAILAHPYMSEALRKVGYSGPLVHESHNFEYSLKERMLPRNAASAKRLSLVEEAEGWCCRSAAFVSVTSRDDATALQRKYGIAAERFLLIPNGTDTATIGFMGPAARRGLRRRLGIGGRPVALFLASGHGPNLEAAERLLEIATRLQDVYFALVGNVADAFAHRAVPSNVWLVGTVSEEARNVWLQFASVALNPVLYGGGTNLKLLDYFAAGTPVVSTEPGIRGGDVDAGRHVLVAPIERFDGAIREALSDGTMIERMTAEARALVEERFDWWKLGDRLHETIVGRGLLAKGR